MTYFEKLKDPRWQKKRLEIFQRDGFACVECGDKQSTLNVHHVKYAKRAAPWDAPDGWLKTLCESCHERVSVATSEASDAVRAMAPARAEEIARALSSGAAIGPSGLHPALARALRGVTGDDAEYLAGFITARRLADVTSEVEDDKVSALCDTTINSRRFATGVCAALGLYDVETGATVREYAFVSPILDITSNLLAELAARCEPQQIEEAVAAAAQITLHHPSTATSEEYLVSFVRRAPALHAQRSERAKET